MNIEDMICRIKDESPQKKEKKEAKPIQFADRMVELGIPIVGYKVHIKNGRLIEKNKDILCNCTVIYNGNKIRIGDVGTSCITNHFPSTVGPNKIGAVKKKIGVLDSSPFPQIAGDVIATIGISMGMTYPMISTIPVKPNRQIVNSIIPKIASSDLGPRIVSVDAYGETIKRKVGAIMQLRNQNINIDIQDDMSTGGYHTSYIRRDRTETSKFISSAGHYFKERRSWQNTEMLIDVAVDIGSSTITGLAKEHQLEWAHVPMQITDHAVIERIKQTGRFNKRENTIHITTTNLAEAMNTALIESRLLGSIRPDIFSIDRICRFIPGVSIPIINVINYYKNLKIKNGIIYKLHKYEIEEIGHTANLCLSTLPAHRVIEIEKATKRYNLGIHQVIPLIHERWQKHVIISAEVGTGKTRAAISRWDMIGKPKCLYITTPRLVHEIKSDEEIMNKSREYISLASGKDKQLKIERWIKSNKHLMLVVSKSDASTYILDKKIKIPLAIIDEADNIVRSDLNIFRTIIDTKKAKINRVMMMTGTPIYGIAISGQMLTNSFNSEEICVRMALTNSLVNHLSSSESNIPEGRFVTKQRKLLILRSCLDIYNRYNSWNTILADKRFSIIFGHIHNNKDSDAIITKHIGGIDTQLSIPVVNLDIRHDRILEYIHETSRDTTAHLMVDSNSILISSTNALYGSTHGIGLTANMTISRKAQLTYAERDARGVLTGSIECRYRTNMKDDTIINDRSPMEGKLGYNIHLFKDKLSILSRFSRKAIRKPIEIKYTQMEKAELVNHSDKYWKSALYTTDAINKTLPEVAQKICPDIQELRTLQNACLKDIDAYRDISYSTQLMNNEDQLQNAVGLKDSLYNIVDELLIKHIGTTKYITSQEFPKGRHADDKNTVIPSCIEYEINGSDAKIVRLNDRPCTPLLYHDDKFAIVYNIITKEDTYPRMLTSKEILARIRRDLTTEEKKQIAGTTVLFIASNTGPSSQDSDGTLYSMAPSTMTTVRHRYYTSRHRDSMPSVSIFKSTKTKTSLGIDKDVVINISDIICIIPHILSIVHSYQGFNTCMDATSDAHSYYARYVRQIWTQTMWKMLGTFATTNISNRVTTHNALEQLITVLGKPEFQHTLYDILCSTPPHGSITYGFTTDKSIVMQRMYRDAVMETNLIEKKMSTKRYDALVALILRKKNVPMIVFTQFPDVAKHLISKLKTDAHIRNNKTRVVGITASTKTGYERKTINNGDTDNMVIVTTIGVLQRGFNLGMANSVVIYDQYHSASSIIQSVGRMERPDAKSGITAYLFSDNTPWGKTFAKQYKKDSKGDIEEVIDVPVTRGVVMEVERRIDEVSKHRLDITTKRSILVERFTKLCSATTQMTINIIEKLSGKARTKK